MDTGPANWIVVSESQFPWEREALAFIQAGWPAHDPYRVWSNFEFVADDGSVNEVDLLALTPKGFFLVEIKSRPGVVGGDAGVWAWTHDGRTVEIDNPLLLANRKAKRLKSLLERQPEWRRTNSRMPFLQPLVFLSAPGINVQLKDTARHGVCIRDEAAPQSTSPATADRAEGILHALKTTTPGQSGVWDRQRVDRVIAKGVTRALEQIHGGTGLKRAQRARRVGDYELGGVVLEGPGYQDFAATHAALKDRGARWRVRIYTVDRHGPRDWAETVARAARREYEILQGINHAGILKAVNYTESELGPALVFEAPPEAMRLDHFLVRHGQQLSLDARLAILRDLADALRYAHERRLFHRALSPASVLVTDPSVQRPRLQVFNWQTALREIATASASTVPSRTGTAHLQELIEAATSIYMAPEALKAPDSAGEAVDVFSLGAIAYHMFAGRPPAENLVELQEKLRANRGLRLPDTVDGACRSLKELVQFATTPDVGARIESADEFIDRLNGVEEELTAPTEGFVTNPMDAKIGSRIPFGSQVARVTSVLGTGSTAIVLVVDHDGEERVLKVSRGPEQDDRIRDEAQVLEKLRHPHVVHSEGLVQVGERPAIVLALAGEKTLRRRLREDGQLSLDLLERFGDDLLDAVRYLEREGVPHRDIKPDNLGVTPMGRGHPLHVVLFDFSLSRTPATEIRAGTAPYLEPFLGERRPPRWDVHAERYAAAVTLYEMATGVLPRWGDGRSDPGALTCEATLEPERLDAQIRTPLTDFFRKALSRDYEERHHNAEEMQRAWRDAFHGERAPSTSSKTPRADHPDLDPHLDAAELDTPLVSIPFSARAQNAMDRANVLTVRDLLRFPVFSLASLRGVGSKTRSELRHAIERLRGRFGEVPAEASESPDLPGDARTVDELAHGLLNSRTRHAMTPEAMTIRRFLGVEDLRGVAPTGVAWPTQADIADSIDKPRPHVAKHLANARKNLWSKWPSLTSVRNDLHAFLERLGGAARVEELGQALLTARGCEQRAPRDMVLAAAVVRAASEVEDGLKDPRWTERRVHGRVFLVLEQPDAQVLGDYVERLGAAADDLAAFDPLASPATVEKALRDVPLPFATPPLPHDRLVRLAAAASKRAAASSRLECYPRRMPAERALNLARGAVLGSKELSAEELRDRVQSRYPEAQPLPDRPALDDLLHAAGLDLRWDDALRDGKGGYRFHTVDPMGLSTRSSVVQPLPTVLDEPIEPTEEVVEARLFEDRLARAARDGGYLVLIVGPGAYRVARRQIAKRFPVREVDADELLLRHMKDVTAVAGAKWDFVVQKDAEPDASPDGRNLRLLVARAMPQVERELLGISGTVVLSNPGLLARYDQLGLLRRIADHVGARGAGGASLKGLWVLVPQTGPGDMPRLGDHPIPVVTKAEKARIPKSWIANVHRSGSNGAAVAEARR